MRFIDPQKYLAFNKIFGSEQSKVILISFLNALIYQEDPKIIDLVIIPPEQASKILGSRDTYLDVKAILNDRSKVIIQMLYICTVLNQEYYMIWLNVILIN